MGRGLGGNANTDDDTVVIVSDIDPIEVLPTENHLERDEQVEHESAKMVFVKAEDESSNTSLESRDSASSCRNYDVKKELDSDDNGCQPDTDVSASNSEISLSHIGKGSKLIANYSEHQRFQNNAINKNAKRNHLSCNVRNRNFKCKSSKDLISHSSKQTNNVLYSSEGFKSEQSVLKIHSTVTCDRGDYKIRLMPASRTPQSTDKKFSCDKCSFKCRLSHHLKRHAVTHNSEKLFVCDICGFTSKRDLRIHRLTHGVNKLYSCSECDVKVKSLNNLKRHKMTHSDEKPFSCDECNFRCKAAGNLKIHKMTHNEDMPFSCHLCSFKCRNSSNLKAHMIVHKDDRRFACDLCDFRSKRFCHLKEHKALHSDFRPFICDKCGFKCKRLSYLRTHKMVHDDVSPYACDLCSFKSKRAGNLKAHRLTHSGEERFSCNKCEYKCRLLKDWNCHKKDHEKC